MFKDRVVEIMAEDEGFVVRVRGLPWSCSVDEVARFFSGKDNVKMTACWDCFNFDQVDLF